MKVKVIGLSLIKTSPKYSLLRKGYVNVPRVLALLPSKNRKRNSWN